MKIHCLIENTSSSPELEAEHGLSLLIETGSHHILFDAGASPAFAENAARMGLDLGRVDAAVLSHGHYDHGGGLLRFLELNPHSPVWASPHAAEPHFNAAGKDIGLSAQLTGHERFRPVPAAVFQLASSPKVVGTTFGEEAWREIFDLYERVRNERYLF